MAKGRPPSGTQEEQACKNQNRDQYFVGSHAGWAADNMGDKPAIPDNPKQAMGNAWQGLKEIFERDAAQYNPMRGNVDKAQVKSMMDIIDGAIKSGAVDPKNIQKLRDFSAQYKGDFFKAVSDCVNKAGGKETAASKW